MQQYQEKMFREIVVLKFIVSPSLKNNLYETSEGSTIVQATYSIMRSNSDLRNSSYFRGVYQVNNFKMRKARTTKRTFRCRCQIQHHTNSTRKAQSNRATEAGSQ